MNRKKIINDPVYGFITIPSDLIFELINHPYFQRLRRIRQTGLTELVYPGAVHTRFHHAIGAMHLMKVALSSLQEKGVYLYEEEIKAALIAILLHDIGHGPLSHSLEKELIPLSHEEIGSVLFQELNEEFNGELTLALQMFNKSYPRKFLNELVASQLDVDRLDYLLRDSFYTGVAEGKISADRIIKMMNVHEDQLVIEEKGLYSIENFLNARRLMYWQVYLHKTSVSAEKMVQSIFKRAKELIQMNFPLTVYNKSLKKILTETSPKNIPDFIKLDDYDIWSSIKSWAESDDEIISSLSEGIIKRDLFKVELTSEKPSKERVNTIKADLMKKGVKKNTISYYVQSGRVTNSAYVSKEESIKIKLKNGTISDVASAADLRNIKAISKIVKKYYLLYPKHLTQHTTK